MEGLALPDIKTFSKVIIIKNGTGTKTDKSMGKNLGNPKTNPCTYGHWSVPGESTDFSTKGPGIIGYP